MFYGRINLNYSYLIFFLLLKRDPYFRFQAQGRVKEIIDDFLKIEVEFRDQNKKAQQKTIYVRKYSPDLNYSPQSADEEDDNGSTENQDGSTEEREPPIPS